MVKERVALVFSVHVRSHGTLLVMFVDDYRQRMLEQELRYTGAFLLLIEHLIVN